MLAAPQVLLVLLLLPDPAKQHFSHSRHSLDSDLPHPVDSASFHHRLYLPLLRHAADSDSDSDSDSAVLTQDSRAGEVKVDPRTHLHVRIAYPAAFAYCCLAPSQTGTKGERKVGAGTLDSTSVLIKAMW